MLTHAKPLITALQAQGLANNFLLEHLPDRITGDQPVWDAAMEVWRIPVILAYPQLGVLGVLGEVQVAANTEIIHWYTPLSEIQERALSLSEEWRDTLEAPLL